MRIFKTVRKQTGLLLVILCCIFKLTIKTSNGIFTLDEFRQTKMWNDSLEFLVQQNVWRLYVTMNYLDITILIEDMEALLLLLVRWASVLASWERAAIQSVACAAGASINYEPLFHKPINGYTRKTLAILCSFLQVPAIVLPFKSQLLWADSNEWLLSGPVILLKSVHDKAGGLHGSHLLTATKDPSANWPL